MNFLYISLCAHRLKSGATQTKPAAGALVRTGFNYNFLLFLVRVGGLRFCSRDFSRQASWHKVDHSKNYQ